ncbi:MAG TPA: TonB-dependent receptor [Chitinophagaceae bacterium]|nr:TonB-dependent receptor [Chitinophagaceae bacterium]
MKMAIKTLMIFISFFATTEIFSQNVNEDTTAKDHKYLPEITVVGLGSKSDIQQLPEIVGTSIYAGKKNALIVMDNVKGNVVTNTMRQVMAKVPGIHVWESDGSGIQIGISARGLSPNRSWEFNVRQNGYDISADPYGYPEAYYNPQLQAVQRVEIVRGHGSLQYGPQFGGMVNYILRNGSEINKPFQVEMQQTAGSFGMINTYNAIGGETKKFHYYAYFDHRSADGWRENSKYFTNSGFGTFTWRLNDKLSVTAEIMKNHINSRQPGGHTDASFTEDAEKSYRSRNWMDIEWLTTALIANYRFDEDHKLNVKVFNVQGDRNSVGYIRAINIPDSIVTATGEYNNRTVDIDNYRNFGVEARYLGDYRLFGSNHSFSGGLRYFRGNTYRYRDGVGTTGIDYDVSRVNPIWPRDIDYHTNNIAAFAENIFRITDKLIVIPGIRYEWISAKATGINGYTNGNPVYLQNQERDRSFLLAGIGAEYHVTANTEVYANITQAYRPMQFADLTAPPTTNEIDPNLKDASGYNADLGYRGRMGSYLYFDVSAFYLQYNNRIGTLSQQRADGSFYNLTTNVGNSASKGFEGVVEFNPVKAFNPSGKWGDVSVFASYGYTDARFGDLQVIQKVGNDLVKTNLKDKRVENAPLNILRGGLTYNFKGFSFTGQLSHVDKAYADANNTEKPTANGQNGVIPAYTITDLTASYVFNKHVNLKAGINNLTNEMYFTRRAGGYPGPGLLPSDGRNFFVSLGLTF